MSSPGTTSPNARLKDTLVGTSVLANAVENSAFHCNGESDRTPSPGGPTATTTPEAVKGRVCRQAPNSHGVGVASGVGLVERVGVGVGVQLPVLDGEGVAVRVAWLAVPVGVRVGGGVSLADPDWEGLAVEDMPDGVLDGVYDEVGEND